MKAFSKKEVLAQTAKIFDPLSLCVPVIVNAKILFGKLWSLKLNWDEEIADEIKNIWSNIVKDLTHLHNISFPRHAVDSDSPLKLYLFYNTLSQAYGFAAYGIQNKKQTKKNY